MSTQTFVCIIKRQVNKVKLGGAKLKWQTFIIKDTLQNWNTNSFLSFRTTALRPFSFSQTEKIVSDFHLDRFLLQHMTTPLKQLSWTAILCTVGHTMVCNISPFIHAKSLFPLNILYSWGFVQVWAADQWKCHKTASLPLSRSVSRSTINAQGVKNCIRWLFTQKLLCNAAHADHKWQMHCYIGDKYGQTTTAAKSILHQAQSITTKSQNCKQLSA